MQLITPYTMNSSLLYSPESLPTPSFPIVLTAKAEQEAKRLAQNCPMPRQQQIYHNALARFAVNHYFQCLGIESDTQATEFQEPFRRILLDIADIRLPDLGIVECCPVLPGSHHIRVPAESWENRIAYFAVEIDLDQHQAILLGFLNCLNPETTGARNSELFSIENFRGIDEFPEFLATAKSPFVELRQWWSDFFASGWSSLDAVIHPTSSNPSTLTYAYRTLENIELQQKMEDFFGGHSLQSKFHHTPSNCVSGYKLISLYPNLHGGTMAPNLDEDIDQTVALVIRAAEGIEEPLEISIDAIPGPRREYLPQNLKLALLDTNRSELLAACAQQHNRHLQLEFSGTKGDAVILHLSLNGLTFEEKIVL